MPTAVSIASRRINRKPSPTAIMSTPQAQAVRRWILTGAITAITVTGAIYGAGLKSKQEFKQVRRHQRETVQHILPPMDMSCPTFCQATPPSIVLWLGPVTLVRTRH